MGLLFYRYEQHSGKREKRGKGGGEGGGGLTGSYMICNFSA